MVPAALQTAVTTIATDGVPTEGPVSVGALAGNTVIGLLLLLLLFGVRSQQLAVTGADSVRPGELDPRSAFQRPLPLRPTMPIRCRP